VTDIYETLRTIAAARTSDPLAPVTVVSPSHAAALQLRRKLAGFGPFAAVRFETLPRLAELIGAGYLAGEGRSPLARPIGDYIAEQVALQARPPFDSVRDIPGFARVLREIFRRLRRGGIRSSRDVQVSGRPGHLAEMLRLYDLFAEGTARFYSDEDLLAAAAEVLSSRGAGVIADLGEVYVVPPGPQTVAGQTFLDALSKATHVQLLDEPEAAPQQSFVISPDPASEAKEAARLVLQALEAGTAIHEIAVLHGAADTYSRLLREAFDAAGVNSVPLPGMPVSESRAGRGAVALARLPMLDYARTAIIDLLSVSRLRDWLPTADRPVHEAATAWDRVSREASVTRGIEIWRRRLGALIRDRETSAAELEKQDQEEYAGRIAGIRGEAATAQRLLSVVEELVARLEPLREEQSSDSFIDRFKDIVETYIDEGAEGYTETLEEIDQLGTIGAVGGRLTLNAFADALAANLDARYIRPRRLGDGVVIADYRAAAVMRFQRVVLCGAFEGAFPAGPGPDSILEDGVWQELKKGHPLIEDAATRISLSKEAAYRAVAAAGDGELTWISAAFDSAGMHDVYPSPLMAEACSAIAGKRVTAAELRSGVFSSDKLHRIPSPLAAALRGPVLNDGELSVRAAIDTRRHGPVPATHPRARSLLALRSRRSSDFTAWDGNLAELEDAGWLEIQSAVSPTSLEHYAACGYRYFCRSLLRLKEIAEPEERQTLDAMTRGNLIHAILEQFFIEQQKLGRPQASEAWTAADRAELLAIADEVLSVARESGQTGLDIFLQHETRTIRADLVHFLDADTAFRRETQAVPTSFEAAIPVSEIAGVRLRGYADRIDWTPDGKRAWVIDYKTGSSRSYEGMKEDPLKGGTKLQLPVYLSAVSDAEEAEALYWFITQSGGFQRVPYRPTPESTARFQATLEAIVGGVRAGSFPAVSGEDDEFRNKFDNCAYCEFDRICSRRRDLEFSAKEADDGIAPWRAVAQAAGAPE
jgi:hypothetical protein